MIKLHQGACIWGGPCGGNKKEEQKCVRNCISKDENIINECSMFSFKSVFFNGHFCSCPYNEVTGSVSVFLCVCLSVTKDLANL